MPLTVQIIKTVAELNENEKYLVARGPATLYPDEIPKAVPDKRHGNSYIVSLNIDKASEHFLQRARYSVIDNHPVQPYTKLVTEASEALAEEQLQARVGVFATTVAAAVTTYGFVTAYHKMKEETHTAHDPKGSNFSAKDTAYLSSAGVGATLLIGLMTYKMYKTAAKFKENFIKVSCEADKTKHNLLDKIQKNINCIENGRNFPYRSEHIIN